MRLVGITIATMKKYFSYSEMYKWEHDRDGYLRTYIDGYEEPANEKMQLGTILHGAIQDPTYPLVEKLKEMDYNKKEIYRLKRAVEKIEVPERNEVMLTAELDGNKLIGFADGMDGKTLVEFKTTDNPKAWSQRRVDNNEQLSLYALMYYLNNHSYFHGIKLWRIDTVKGTAKKFETSRGPRDIAYIRDKALGIIGEIKAAGLWTKRLSRQDIALRNQLSLLAPHEPGFKRIGDMLA